MDHYFLTKMWSGSYKILVVVVLHYIVLHYSDANVVTRAVAVRSEEVVKTIPHYLPSLFTSQSLSNSLYHVRIMCVFS